MSDFHSLVVFDVMKNLFFRATTSFRSVSLAFLPWERARTEILPRAPVPRDVFLIVFFACRCDDADSARFFPFGLSTTLATLFTTFAFLHLLWNSGWLGSDSSGRYITSMARLAWQKRKKLSADRRHKNVAHTFESLLSGYKSETNVAINFSSSQFALHLTRINVKVQTNDNGLRQ